MKTKLINGYWVDENNNKWDESIYTQQQADKYSNTLINCKNCINCSRCSDCSDCSGCLYCSYCSRCSDCARCSDCSGCSDCSDCSYCLSCSGCSYCARCSGCLYCSYCLCCSYCARCSDCSGCSDCSDCSYCSGCSDFKTNPQRITSNNIGSRNSQTTIYWNDKNEQVICGCFKGTIQEFKDKVKRKHKNNEHAKQYNKWIKLVEKYIKANKQ